MTVRFDDAWSAAIELAGELTADGFDVVVVRDLLGRVSFVVTDSDEHALPDAVAQRARESLQARCTPFVADTPLLPTRDLFIPQSITAAGDLLVRAERDDAGGRGRLAVLERGVVGREWHRLAPAPSLPFRVALYGFKGGVGRSTATTVLARYLADIGKCVLVVDLDLESPGVSAISLSSEEMPDHGIVDFLVEVGVGNAAALECVSRSSRLRVPGNGEVWVAPAGGRPREGYTYIPKLNRAYLDYPDAPVAGPPEAGDTGRWTFSRRIGAAVDHCVAEVERQSRTPDVVLLDSRAGIHDLAAVAITQLAHLSLLFGIDNSQTWNGYRELFSQWGTDPDLARGLRERLKVVASMVPAAAEAAYLEAFRDSAQTCLSVLYDQADPDDPEAFNPPLSDDDAPHAPVPILFSSDLVGLDVTRGVEWLEQDFVAAAFGRFVRVVADLIFGIEEGAAWDGV